MSRWVKISGVALLVLLVVGGAIIGWTYHAIARSVPLIEGRVKMAGLAAEVTVERDALGVPTVRGSNRLDVARALGFLHAQERFFQMDLMRRQAAGELAELFGAVALDADRASRVHRFRDRSGERLAELPSFHRKVLTAYTEGVNAGLEAIDGRPFEYLLLRIDPAPWMEEDSVLVSFANFFVLNDAMGKRESDLGLLHDLLPEDLAGFLAPHGTEWDAPVVGEAFETLPIPSYEESTKDLVAASHHRPDVEFLETGSLIGSNNWAVAGSRTADGRAILANDMHLPLAVPNTWYRAVLEWPADDGCRPMHRLLGVTIPGGPIIVGGSNTRVAWGFTNSYGDWSDLVIVEVDDSNPGRYRTPDGWREMERRVETIVVRDGEPESFEVVETVWGPIIDHDHLGRPRAVRWIAHDPGGANLGHLDLEHVTSIEEAVEVANRTGMPPQNFVCADSKGSIGWTIIGLIPRRIGQAGPIPVSWADGSNGWDGWLEPGEYPRIIDPPDGLIWTANARVVGGEMLELIGDGGYDLGARAQQIRDDLRALESVTEDDMLAVQLDDRAVFLERWRGLLLDLLDDEAVRSHPERKEFRDLVEATWNGRASTDSVAFRLIRAFRTFTLERVYGWLTAACEAADEDFSVYRLPQKEGPLWRLVTERPAHLLDPKAESWREELLAVVDSTIRSFTEFGGNLEDQTWGARNTLSMRHPLSRAVPALSRWLDMPQSQLPGDSKMPRVQSPGFGASERLAVSPGREGEGYFHMPGGQSGHPLSPYYSAGHQAWVEGLQSPFLPGATESVLTMVPPAD
jgi:penicillin amidase